MNAFLKRSLTGGLYVAAILGSILAGSSTFFLLFAIAMALSMFEFYRLSRFLHIQTQKFTGIGIALVLYTFGYLHAIHFITIDYFLVLIPLIGLVFINELYLYNKRPFSSIAFTLTGIIYIAFPFTLLNYLVLSAHETHGLIENSNSPMGAINQIINFFYFLKPSSTTVEYNPAILLGLLFLIWTFDTSAYIFGVLFGRHRLFERISPKKSWEGFIAGSAFTIGLSLILQYIPDNFLDRSNWIHIALIVIIAGTYGDLVESMLKRSIHVKDSGSVLPGHGGLLDRFDSLIFAIPMVYVYLQVNS